MNVNPYLQDGIVLFAMSVLFTIGGVGTLSLTSSDLVGLMPSLVWPILASAFILLGSGIFLGMLATGSINTYLARRKRVLDRG